MGRSTLTIRLPDDTAQRLKSLAVLARLNAA
jgi:predicted transcriptional regulator